MAVPFSQVALYGTPDELQSKVDEYFEVCNIKIRGYNVNTPTMAGLADYLGFSSRRQLLNYKNDANPEYERVINRAKLRIEAYLEGQLVHSKSPAGIIFALKNNADWEDTKKVQTDGDSNNMKRVFAWATDAKDVIDVDAKTPLPSGGGENKGSHSE